MTFEELWATLPVPFGYEHMDELDKARWKAMVEAAFRTGLFEGTYKNGCAQTADGRRISSLEAAVEEIRAAMAMPNLVGAQPTNIRAKCMESALKVIHTWASFPESFDFEQAKRLCMSALGREK